MNQNLASHGSVFIKPTEIMALRGIIIGHETVRQWAQRFGVDMGIKFRACRWKNVGKKWHIDITYF